VQNILELAMYLSHEAKKRVIGQLASREVGVNSSYMRMTMEPLSEGLVYVPTEHHDEIPTGLTGASLLVHAPTVN
jgi:hypothetical protein